MHARTATYAGALGRTVNLNHEPPGTSACEGLPEWPRPCVRHKWTVGGFTAAREFMGGDDGACA